MTIAEIKREFMVYRNGVVADALRKAGLPYGVVFGLQVPQLGAIAAKCRASAAGDAEIDALARSLWADTNVRESRLLACWLFDAGSCDAEQAYALGSEVQTREEADILCFKFLRRLPYAAGLALRLSTAEGELARYCGQALYRNIGE